MGSRRLARLSFAARRAESRTLTSAKTIGELVLEVLHAEEHVALRLDQVSLRVSELAGRDKPKTSVAPYLTNFIRQGMVTKELRRYRLHPNISETERGLG